MATGTGWCGEPFQQIPGLLPSLPQVTSCCRIRAGRTSTTSATRRISFPRCLPVILPSMVRSSETTQEKRLVTSGRPWSSTIRPRCGCTTICRTDWDAALATYSSPPTT